jgi:hypothetical protein
LLGLVVHESIWVKQAACSTMSYRQAHEVRWLY